MKGRKFAGVLLLIGAVALVMIGAMYIMAIPKEKVAIDDSIMLKDGMYNAKNAGKRVTLILDYKSLEHALDEQLGLEFWATLVRRDVDRFERREGGGYQWKNVSINSVDPLRYKTLHGQTDGGDRVSLDPEFEKRITTKENLGVEDLTDWSLKDFKKGNTKRKAVVGASVTASVVSSVSASSVVGTVSSVACVISAVVSGTSGISSIIGRSPEMVISEVPWREEIRVARSIQPSLPGKVSENHREISSK